MQKLRNFINFLKKYGPPHEETVMIPSLVAIILARQYDMGSLSLGLAVSLTSVCFISCGVWLGLAWERNNVLLIIFRAIYMGVIISLGYGGLTNFTEEPREYVKFSSLIVSTYGSLFYFAWVIGSSLRELMFLTDEQKKLGYERRKILLHIIDVAVHRAKPTSRFYGIIGVGARAAFTSVVGTLLLTALYYALYDYMHLFPDRLKFFVFGVS